MKRLHIYGQGCQHDEAAIVGTREALQELAKKIDLALSYPPPTESNGEFFAGDGEGFDLKVICIGEGGMDGWFLPYHDDSAVDHRKDAKNPFLKDRRRANVDRTLEQTWGALGYQVRWSEREPRAYEVSRIVSRKFLDGARLEIGPMEARLATVQEVTKWISENPNREFLAQVCGICNDVGRIGSDIPCPYCNPEGK